ncbi:thiol-disulfide oxidoreductase DCC family protein [Aequorivita sp. H23M31]|uniref:Thiol-disulfide oxidoreductase DCC family protein n=1 Tax=Aequorivita ciconiae TaxID=2494375 RepID=A0A410G7G3_9FLAO|nr:thiol-disulfide oxidoreductase DCC family protein [Aequorivita sp. H23M31]
MEHKIILFDGVCNLCNGAINFVIKRDKRNVFKFATLQSEIGKKLLSEFNVDTMNIDSMILIDGNNFYIKSSAALRIAKYLTGGYPLLSGFFIFPRFIRNAAYDYIARNRYKWFGKKESCMIPTPELTSKFL